MIIDDLFSSRLLLAEIVRQIDGKLGLGAIAHALETDNNGNRLILEVAQHLG